jgi:hypothetical protein
LFIISNFRSIANSLPSVDESKADQFNFFKSNRKYYVPTIPSSKKRTAIKHEALLHALKFYLFRNKLLNNPD